MEQLPLKDIHLPQSVGWWPLAPGWWALAVLLLLLSVTGLFLYKRLKQQTALRTAGKMLAAIRNDRRDDLQTLIALSALLRRVAISTASRTDVAALRGSAWLAYLDRPFPDAPFSNGIGHCLADAQYRQSLSADTDMDELFKLCERWLNRQKKPLFSFPGGIGKRWRK
ncbi:MAG: DUF4381 domain-containing protein [Methylococcales bacterium]|nr:DUF4381 domain-containing protein [Methylococcales bacterium]